MERSEKKIDKLKKKAIECSIKWNDHTHWKTQMKKKKKSSSAFYSSRLLYFISLFHGLLLLFFILYFFFSSKTSSSVLSLMRHLAMRGLKKVCVIKIEKIKKKTMGFSLEYMILIGRVIKIKIGRCKNETKQPKHQTSV